MVLFLFCAFPLLLIIASSASSNIFRFRAWVIGLLAGIIACTARALFMFQPRDIPAGFLPQFLRSYCELAAAVSILLMFFFIIIRGDAREKARAFIFVMLAYFAVMVPYRVISGVYAPGFFEYNIVPLIYAAMSVGCAVSAAWFQAALSKKTQAPFLVRVVVFLVSVGVFLLSVAFPCAAETSRMAGGGEYMMITPVSLVFSVILLCLFPRRKESPR
ncbi:MAG: hypothetical protein Pg6C_13190 [Treponemataceae bacterium]|nr:MAG: hypothetical protein Pg6C_13190 [Treponemataceae bacterium]